MRAQEFSTDLKVSLKNASVYLLSNLDLKKNTIEERLTLPQWCPI